MKKLEIHNNYNVYYRQQKFNNSDKTVLFLHGLMSDMNGSKSIAIENYCIKHKINYVAFDNLGHGNSSEEFTKCTMSLWLKATEEVIKKLQLNNIIIVGSSMGGWLSLLLSIKKLSNIKGQILIAPAPDFTEKIWRNFSSEEKKSLYKGEFAYLYKTESQSGIPISMELIEDGREHLLLGNKEIKISIPTIIIHGMKDTSVDYSVSQILTEKISAPYLCTKFIKYGEHRLSEPSDLANIFDSINFLLQSNDGFI